MQAQDLPRGADPGRGLPEHENRTRRGSGSLEVARTIFWLSPNPGVFSNALRAWFLMTFPTLYFLSHPPLLPTSTDLIGSLHVPTLSCSITSVPSHTALPVTRLSPLSSCASLGKHLTAFQALILQSAPSLLQPCLHPSAAPQSGFTAFTNGGTRTPSYLHLELASTRHCLSTKGTLKRKVLDECVKN